MRTKKILISAGVTAVVAISFTFGLLNNNKSYAGVSNVTVANIDAFMSTNSLDCEYIRKEENCEVTIEAGAGLKIFGGKIIGSDETCKPVECIDIYKIVTND